MRYAAEETKSNSQVILHISRNSYSAPEHSRIGLSKKKLLFVTNMRNKGLCCPQSTVPDMGKTGKER